MNARTLLPLLAAGSLAACAMATQSSREGQTPPPGDWGGDQVELRVAPDGGGHIELSCASVEFDGPVKLDVGGHFLTKGIYAPGTGVATMQPPASVPANISGRLDERGVLWLDVATRDSYPVRSARLERGKPANLLRCL